jgi:hypothetical protein
MEPLPEGAQPPKPQRLGRWQQILADALDQMRSKSFTGSSAVSIDVSDAI